MYHKLLPIIRQAPHFQSTLTTPIVLRNVNILIKHWKDVSDTTQCSPPPLNSWKLTWFCVCQTWRTSRYINGHQKCKILLSKTNIRPNHICTLLCKRTGLWVQTQPLTRPYTDSMLMHRNAHEKTVSTNCVSRMLHLLLLHLAPTSTLFSFI